MAKPLFIAKQSRHAHGLLGRIVAFVMARETDDENATAITALGVTGADRVLDIGCGHGRGVERLAAGAAFVAGVDPSKLMAEIATKRNAKAVKAGRVGIHVAPVEQLPFEAATFDKALCVHVIYFWRDIASPFAEVARVLKPGGRLALLFRGADDEAAVREFPSEVYRFPDAKSVAAALEKVGFSVDLRAADVLPRPNSPPPWLIVATRQGQ